jgi:C-terminal processing protease CtpA/Prc
MNSVIKKNQSRQKIIKQMCFIILFLSSASSLQADVNSSLSSNKRDSVIREVAKAIDSNYFDAEIAHKISKELINNLDAGKFNDVKDSTLLATEMTKTLSKYDRHFNMRFTGGQGQQTMRQRRHTSDDSDPYAAARRRNFGYSDVKILPGNVGYIKLNEFADIQVAQETAIGALKFIQNTDAVVFDLRENTGGAPSMVQFLISHFIQPGGRTLINTFVSRDREYPREIWSLNTHPVGNRTIAPLYILTSGTTGSAGEAFPYHLKAMGRGTVVGEKTYGAGNPGSPFAIDGENYSLFISTGSARNPITNNNWEGIGVIPNIDVSAELALDKALIDIYEKLGKSNEDPIQKMSINWASELLSLKLTPFVLSEKDMGRYQGVFGKRKVYLEDGKLLYRREGASVLQLVPLGNDRFAFSGVDSYRIIIKVDANGKAESMELHISDGQVINNPRTN